MKQVQTSLLLPFSVLMMATNHLLTTRPPSLALHRFSQENAPGIHRMTQPTGTQIQDKGLYHLRDKLVWTNDKPYLWSWQLPNLWETKSYLVPQKSGVWSMGLGREQWAMDKSCYKHSMVSSRVHWTIPSGHPGQSQPKRHIGEGASREVCLPGANACRGWDSAVVKDFSSQTDLWLQIWWSGEVTSPLGVSVCQTIKHEIHPSDTRALPRG